MFGALICSFLLSSAPLHAGSSPFAQDAQPRSVPKVALFPWSYCENESGTSSAGIQMAENVLRRLFEDQGQMAVQPLAESRAAWNAAGGQPWISVIEEPKDQPQIPNAALLLKFGRTAGVDYVAAGRIYWHVRSVWVGLGPKTKANATIDVTIIDVNKGEVAYEVRNFKSDSNKAEKWYETGGALFLTWGITLLSGGPKTPQIERATAIGLGGATDDFFRSLSGR
ncbi:MAG: hypothetical protein SNJ76_10765, partial [Fimbriimonadaceae bacterium]